MSEMTVAETVADTCARCGKVEVFRLPDESRWIEERFCVERVLSGVKG